MQEFIKRLKNITVLYCEDEENLRTITSNILNKFIKKLFIANDGVEGLETFNNYADEIDIIITDISMPNMGGLEMAKEIKKINPDIPVIVTTAFSSSDYLLEAIDINVDKYVLKPIDIKKLIEAINQSLLYHELRVLYKDPLTKLPTRNALIRDMQTREESLIALLDIDKFTEINYLYGEESANKILLEYSNKLREFFEDIAHIYREGADSFVLLFDDPTMDISELKRRLGEFIDFVEDNGVIIDDISIYVLTIATIAKAKEDSLKYAQKAMIELKRDFTKRKIYQYKNSHENSYEDNIKWIKEFKNSSNNSRFRPFYQPIIDTKTEKVVKFEALLRYKSDDGKEITPFEFLDIAKKARIYSVIIKIVLHNAINIIKKKGIRVSINISYEDIINKDTLKYIYDTLKSNPQEANKIDFEILESEIIDDYEAVMDFISNIRSFGCKIGVDDFGSGYSNFSILEKLNIDFIKIDGSLIKDIVSRDRQRLIVESINDFAHKLGIYTVAEMVSDKEAFDIVKEIGIDYVQGWYFAKAVDESELDKYV
jgi:EAL domain-containing protein (putative c-di-GMP-specific phosphodiesterase class I)/CheY-like chemotaxis protein